MYCHGAALSVRSLCTSDTKSPGIGPTGDAVGCTTVGWKVWPAGVGEVDDGASDGWSDGSTVGEDETGASVVGWLLPGVWVGVALGITVGPLVAGVWVGEKVWPASVGEVDDGASDGWSVGSTVGEDETGASVG